MFEPWWDKLYDQTAQRIGQRSSKISGTAQGFNNCEKRADFYEEIKNSKSVRSIEGKIKVSKSLVNDRFNSVSNLPCAIEMMEISEDNIQSDSEVVKDTSFSTKKILKRPGRRNFTRDVDVLVPRRKKTKKMQSSRLV